MGKAELVEQVKALQRAGAKEVWWNYCDEQLGGVRDPNRHDDSVLEQFLAQAGSLPQAGSHVQNGSAPVPAAPRWAQGGGKGGGKSGPPRGGGGSRLGSPSMPAVPFGSPGPGWVYVGEPAAMSMGYAGHGGHGMMGGMMGGPPTSGGVTELVGFVKMGQRMSQNFKAAWAHYCQIYGSGRNDPAGYDSAHIAGFVDYMGQLGAADLGAVQQHAAPTADFQGHKRHAPAGTSQPPPGKRHQSGKGGQDYGAQGNGTYGNGAHGNGSGVPSDVSEEKAALITRVKAVQRRSPETKASWWKACDEHPTQPGVKDPARHDTEMLEAFLAQCE